MKSLWNKITGQSKTETQNQSANQQANIQQQIAPQYNMDTFQQDFCEEQEYPDVSHTHKERMTEDVVESQTQANPL
jgi:hypothetical protein